MNIVENFDLFAPRLINKKELLSAGHRACSGCAEVLAVRLMCKALGEHSDRLRDRLYGNCIQYVSHDRVGSALDSRRF